MTAALLLDRPLPMRTAAAVPATPPRPAPRHDVPTVGVEPTGGRAGTSTVRHVLPFVLAGAAPLLAIPALAMDLAPAAVSAITAVAALAVAAALAVLGGTGRRRTGPIAGLVALTAVSAVQLPLVAAGVWPDFVPDLGGPVPADASPFSLWRYLGDGGGAGMFAFLLAGLLLAVRPHWISGRTVAVAVGYGVFVWTGLVAALMLPGGPATAFTLSPSGFVGHLVHGAVLGAALLVALRHITRRRPVGC